VEQRCKLIRKNLAVLKKAKAPGTQRKGKKASKPAKAKKR